MIVICTNNNNNYYYAINNNNKYGRLQDLIWLFKNFPWAGANVSSKLKTIWARTLNVFASRGQYSWDIGRFLRDKTDVTWSSALYSVSCWSVTQRGTIFRFTLRPKCAALNWALVCHELDVTGFKSRQVQIRSLLFSIFRPPPPASYWISTVFLSRG